MEIPERVRKLKKKTAPILTPQFGSLQGVRVLQTATLIAVPHAGTMLADFGAELIQVENPGAGDTWRSFSPYIPGDGNKVSCVFAQEAHNRLSMELDMRINKNPLSREVFLGLIKVSDIWLENLVWLKQRYGITDELVREVNPQITIVHESGYGKPEFGGDPDRCWKAAYDLIGQSHGGWCHLVGEPKGTPTRIAPGSSDYVAAFSVSMGALMGYIDALETGKGQTIDVAQFEAIGRMLGDNFSRYFNLNEVPTRTGNRSLLYQPNNIFKASDGYIAISVSEPDQFQRFLQAMAETTGLNPDNYPWTEVNGSEKAINSPMGKELEKITTDWIGRHTKKEVDDLFVRHSVPSTPVCSAEDAANDPHWLQRGDFVECIDQTIQKKIKIGSPVPKFSQTPGRVWRGAPALGQDTEDILSRILNYTPEEINKLRAEKIICK
ncbi:MAG: CoA transferase [Dehalococcoidia bacterium]|nr:CoA transferase [Dehalococcoidia bacterium]